MDMTCITPGIPARIGSSRFPIKIPASSYRKTLELVS
jgi:hypothetical protein